jgi:hypothetical protein
MVCAGHIAYVEELKLRTAYIILVKEISSEECTREM